MEDLIRWRRELHTIPEIGLHEFKTAKYIRNELKKMNLDYHEILGTGTYVFIDNHCKDTLGFRADIDALPIEEKNNISFKSTHKGYMHACGHDGHTSAMLGLASRIRTITNPRYNYLLLFQPAEESPGAAKDIVKTGIFNKYNVIAMFGMHLMPTIDEGVIVSKAGPLFAQCGELDVYIQGKSAHAGLYHQGIDSIVIASQLINNYQSIISRRISPFESTVLNIGTISGGMARNSVASECEFHGTIRCYSEQVFSKIVEDIININKGYELAYGCTIKATCPPMYPPLINDYSVYNRVKEISNIKELSQPLMLAEDFAFYTKAIPSLFFFLGVKTKEYNSGLHTETFNFNEEVLFKAVDFYMNIAINY